MSFTQNTCPISGSQHIESFFELNQMPVHVGLQWGSKVDALNCPKGDLKLMFCKENGFVYNASFDEKLMDYEGEYDNSLDHSPRFTAFITDVAQRLIDKYDVRNKNIVEIGCGKGDFLKLICMQGENSGVGFDPSVDKDISGDVDDNVTLVRGYYSAENSGSVDLLCCRHVFEHMPEPLKFLSMVRESIKPDQNPVIYFEVPSTAAILRDMAVWNIIYEHCSYFSVGSLAHVFERCGFIVNDVYETYGNQFIGIEATVARKGSAQHKKGAWDDAEEMRAYIKAFQSNFQQMTEQWRKVLEKLEKENKQTVLWGAGAKAQSFLNMLKIRDQIEYVIDINPNKQGTYVAGTGQQIVAPDFLTTNRPDTVIVMNPIYEKEIRNTIEGYGLQVEMLLAS